MRKRNCLLLLAGVATLTLNSCKNDEDAQSSSDMNFEVSFEGDAANQLKTTLVKEKNTYYNSWTSGDQVAITDGNVLSTFQTEASGRVRALFSRISGDKLSEEEGNTYLAYYPASGCVSYAGDSTFNVTLPRYQTYNEDGTVSENAYPMIGVSSSAKMPLYNLGGVIKITCTCDTPIPFDSLLITSKSKKLSGFAIATIKNDTPIITMSNENTSNSVTLQCNKDTVNKDGRDFYIILPSGTYPAKDISYKFCTPYFKTTVSNPTTLDLKRSSIYNAIMQLNIAIKRGENGEYGVTID